MAPIKKNKLEEIISELFVSANVIKSIIFKTIKNNKNIDYNHSSAPVLQLLNRKGVLSMTEICSCLCISKPNLTVIVDQLIEKKLVKRVYEKNDRRLVKIEITKKGKILILESKKFVIEGLKKVLQNLDDSDVEKFSRSMKDINMVLSKIKVSPEVHC